MARFPLLVLAFVVFLLGLVTAATPSSRRTHLRELRARVRHRNPPATTTTTTSADGAAATNATSSANAQHSNDAASSAEEPAGNITTTTTTLPDVCLPTTESCLDELRLVADMAHNTTAETTERDNSLDRFCQSTCGQK